MSKKVRVLYVDDEEINLKNFQDVFADIFTVYITTSIHEAFSILESVDIHVILSDQRMPELSGTEFFAQIRQRHPKPIRVLLTGYSDIEVVIDSINKGKIFEYMQKPWTEIEVEESILRSYKAYLSINKDNFSPKINSKKLIEELERISLGNNDAVKYHDYIYRVFQILFEPHLRNPDKEERINNGRKRIDLTFFNASRDGFFYRLSMFFQIKCPYIIIECKNYSTDVNNPELDQIAGRLNSKRGNFGILACRKIEDGNLLIDRLRDILHDSTSKHIIFITDNDLKLLIEYKSKNDEQAIEDLLTDKVKKLIM